jgi:hypothetical protein
MKLVINTTPSNVRKGIIRTIKQGFRSMDDDGESCKYQSPLSKGGRCAIGHMVPDKEMRNYMDGVGTIATIVEDSGSDMSGHTLVNHRGKEISMAEESLLDDLQRVHDTDYIQCVLNNGKISKPQWRKMFNEQLKVHGIKPITREEVS